MNSEGGFMQHSTTFNLQMNHIILGYSDNNRLVYNETEKQFLNLGSLKITEGFIRDRALVLEKVKTFIEENFRFMSDKLSSQLNPLLEKRIRVVNSTFYSFFKRFFLWLFNKSTPLKHEEQALRDLKEFLSTTNFPATESIPLIIEKEKSEDSEVVTFPNDQFLTPTKKPLPTTPYKSPYTSTSKALSFAPIAISNSIPPPPPPLIQQEPRFTGEPEPLPFHEHQFQLLKKEEVEKQINEIDLYVAAMKVVLNEVQKLIDQHDTLINQVNESKKEIQNIKTEKERYENIIFNLHLGIEKNEPIFLTYMSMNSLNSGWVSTIPFIPEQRFEAIKQRHVELCSEAEGKKKDILSKLKQLEMAETEEERLAKKELISELEELDKNVFNIDILSDVFKASDCKKKIESRLEVYKPGRDKYKNYEELLLEVEKDEKQILQIKENVNNVFPFEQYKVLLNTKTEQIRKWERVRQSRAEFLKPPKEKLFKSKEIKASGPLVEEFPELIHYMKLPHSVTTISKVNTGASKTGIYDKLHYLPSENQVNS